MSVLDYILHHAESPKARAAREQRKRHDIEIDRIRLGLETDRARQRRRVRQMLAARVDARRSA